MDWKSGEAQTIAVNGISLEAVCFGPKPDAAPTIVMLHEGLGCVALWRDFPQKLAEATGCGVFVYSRPGYGRSDKIQRNNPITYMHDEAMSVLPVVLDTIGFERGILLGHSDGASIATIYAGGVEDLRIRGLVLIAPHFFTEPMGLEAIRQTKADFETSDLKPKLAKYHDNVDHAFYSWANAWLHEDFVDWNIGDAIDYLRIPVLGLQGKDDQYGTLAQLDELENRLYAPFDRAVLAECAHSPHLEKPEETLQIVSEFCQRLNRIENEDVALVRTHSN